MTCKFTHFFPPVQQPENASFAVPPPKESTKKCNGVSTRPPPRSLPTFPPKRPPSHPPKKKVDFFLEKIIFFIYLSPPFGIYTQTPPPKAIVQNK